MNLHALHILNDKAQQALQAEKLDMLEVALEQMLDETRDLIVKQKTARTMKHVKSVLDNLTQTCD